MRLFLDPQLTREAVLAAVQRQAEAAGEYRQIAETVYNLPVSQREEAFSRLYAELFGRWGLDRVPQQIAAEFSHLEPPVTSLYFSAVSHPAEEEALLSREGGKVGIKLSPGRFLEPLPLEGILRHQLTHISDAVRHGFAAPNGRQGEAAVRDRYLVLWDTYIDGRLASQGRRGAEPREARLARFGVAFPHLPPEAVLACFEGIWGAGRLEHRDLLPWAQEPARLAQASPQPGPAPGARCPLCAFPTHDWAPPDSRLAELVQADFPLWRPEQRLCWRCAELYQVRAGIW